MYSGAIKKKFIHQVCKLFHLRREWFVIITVGLHLWMENQEYAILHAIMWRYCNLFWIQWIIIAFIVRVFIYQVKTFQNFSIKFWIQVILTLGCIFLLPVSNNPNECNSMFPKQDTEQNRCIYISVDNNLDFYVQLVAITDKTTLQRYHQ